MQSAARYLYTPKYIREQINWRREQVKIKSPLCWVQGSCIQCGCEIKGKTTADMGCENPPYCYPEMMGKKEWRKFKKDNFIEIIISKTKSKDATR